MFNEFNNNLKSARKQKKGKNSKNLEIKLNKTDFNRKSKYNNESSFLRQYKKYFQKKLAIKYNILPKEYISMQLENFVKAKYCHSLAKFKEDLLFNYEQEFLKRYYLKKEAIKKLPLFSEFYKTYLLFFCSPTLSELNLNELIEEMVERKAKAFYQENYKEENEDKKGSKKIINTIFFTNKVRKDISRKNTLTELSKTTIDFINTTNKNSIRSYISINNLINEIGNGDNNKNLNLINKNAITSRKNNKKDKITNIIKNIETNYHFHINHNLIRKKNIKNSSKNINQPENKSNNTKKIKEIKVKSNNNTQINFSNKNIVTLDTNQNKNKENNYNISKPLYHKINIVNNKIIIINNNRSKGNINTLKASKEKIKKKNNITAISRNYNNNFFAAYSNKTSGLIYTKDRINNNQNYNTNVYLLKTLKDSYQKKINSKQNYLSIPTKSKAKIKHIKIIKEENLTSVNKEKTNIQSYNNKKLNSNLFMNYLNNYKNVNNNINVNLNINLSNSNKIRKKKLTNYQMFSNNIKNINHIQKIKNVSKEKFGLFNKMIHSTCSLTTSSKNKMKKKLKINTTYNTLENLHKSKYNNTYRKKCFTQEQFKTILQINPNNLNKNILSLRLTKK